MFLLDKLLQQFFLSGTFYDPTTKSQIYDIVFPGYIVTNRFPQWHDEMTFPATAVSTTLSTSAMSVIMKQPSVARSRSPNWRQRFGLLKQGTLTEGEATVDLLVLIRFNYLLLILNILFTFLP